MGQKKALFYKYWILTKRSKLAFICQVVTPLMCLAIIRLTLYLAATIPAQINLNKYGVVPRLIYPANLLTPKWQDKYSSVFQIEANERVNRWGAHSEELKSTFEKWIRKIPNAFSYEIRNYRN
jgi:hypothetical protein